MKKVTKIDFGIPATQEEMKILKEAADIPADTAQTDEAEDTEIIGLGIPVTQEEMKKLKEAADIPNADTAQTDEEEEEEIAYPFYPGS